MNFTDPLEPKRATKSPAFIKKTTTKDQLPLLVSKGHKLEQQELDLNPIQITTCFA
jgi:hypothetical protein